MTYHRVYAPVLSTARCPTHGGRKPLNHWKDNVVRGWDLPEDAYEKKKREAEQRNRNPIESLTALSPW